MSKGEWGFSVLELIVVTAIVSAIALAAGMTVYQISESSGQSQRKMVVINQVQNAGFWVGRDAQMADNVTTDNLTSPNFLVLDWTTDNTSDSHRIVYTLEDVSGSQRKKLMRYHYVNTSLTNTTFIAKNIESDPQKTSCESVNGTLLFNVTSAAGEGAETRSEAREYRIVPRI